MTNSNGKMAGNSPSKSEAASEGKQLLLKDIGKKWNKFSEQDVAALKDREGLVALVVAKYGLDKAKAQADVESVLKGRHI